jgi:HPt (histidine-containing phosphotransfer) domain-containing protein
VIDHVSAPPLVPEERPIDFEHLFRMTLGDHALEREVLQLFDRQSGMLMERIVASEPAVIAAFAHTLKGSARGIGAWQVARSADVLESAALAGKALEADIHTLALSVREARTVISELLRAH